MLLQLNFFRVNLIFSKFKFQAMLPDERKTTKSPTYENQICILLKNSTVKHSSLFYDWI